MIFSNVSDIYLFVYYKVCHFSDNSHTKLILLRQFLVKKNTMTFVSAIKFCSRCKSPRLQQVTKVAASHQSRGKSPKSRQVTKVVASQQCRYKSTMSLQVTEVKANCRCCRKSHISRQITEVIDDVAAKHRCEGKALISR